MAYRHFPSAPFLECWSTGTSICVREVWGEVTSYACSLGVVTEPQVNVFRSPVAIWCLRKDGVVYVGRPDCTYSGFRESDGLLVKYGAWEHPFRREFLVAGQYAGRPAYVDNQDSRTIYTCDPRKVFRLNTPIAYTEMPTLICQDVVHKREELTIYQGGVLVDVDRCGTWIDPYRKEWANRPLRL